MNLLALDTSTEYCSAALWRDGALFDRVERAGQRHSELLIEMIRAVLKSGGVDVRQLAAIATTVGPGSFTGVRIAIAVAQGLAFGAKVPAVGIGTLEAIAWGCNADRVVVANDARMGEVYCAAFTRSESELSTLWGPVLASPNAVPSVTGRGFAGAGSGFTVYRDALMGAWREAVTNVIDDAYPSARHVAELAARKFARGETVCAELLAPVYVRDKVALTVDER